ncbi:MAG: hypothetical protein Q8M20_14355 [Rhodocyclaceae bacterium]|nr:hypothetical protein [Rhodocyclaceae bacterium]MDZ4216183.1 hypothetical protein [Rhodocyclaceae bacterium]
MSTTYTSDCHVPVKRLQLDAASGALMTAPKKALFLRGPISLAWLKKAAELPGKSLNVALALCWLNGMAKGKPFKLTQLSLNYLHVARDAARDGLTRLEQAGLITVDRKTGRRPIISILELRPVGQGED